MKLKFLHLRNSDFRPCRAYLSHGMVLKFVYVHDGMEFEFMTVNKLHMKPEL